MVKNRFDCLLKLIAKIDKENISLQYLVSVIYMYTRNTYIQFSREKIKTNDSKPSNKTK